jgi:mono/diheme cytochrome c family protein
MMSQLGMDGRAPASRGAGVHLVWMGMVALLLLAACAAERPAPVDARDLDPFSPDALCAYHLGDPAAGEALFNRPVLAGSGGCATCHSLAPDTILVGPSLHAIATSAETRVPDVIAANYLYLSIVDPDLHVFADFDGGVMPDRYGEELTQEEIADLVSYLFTLNGE